MWIWDMGLSFLTVLNHMLMQIQFTITKCTVAAFTNLRYKIESRRVQNKNYEKNKQANEVPYQMSCTVQDWLSSELSTKMALDQSLETLYNSFQNSLK